MSGVIEARLAELGETLPPAPAPAANYAAFAEAGGMLFISGQISKTPERAYLGRLGAEVGLEEGREAARLCALGVIAQAKAALGALDRVARIVKLTGFVQSAPDFTDQHLVMNGASDLIVEVFGEAGRHARSVLGAAALPLGVAVEIEAMIAVREP